MKTIDTQNESTNRGSRTKILSRARTSQQGSTSHGFRPEYYGSERNNYETDDSTRENIKRSYL